jgi:hypothetical protein
LKNAEVIEKDESLQPLRSEPEFQKMLSELTAKWLLNGKDHPWLSSVLRGLPWPAVLLAFLLAYRLYWVTPPSPLY